MIKNSSESSQTTDSLWGLAELPVYDVSANTNTELVSAAAANTEIVSTAADANLITAASTLNICLPENRGDNTTHKNGKLY